MPHRAAHANDPSLVSHDSAPPNLSLSTGSTPGGIPWSMRGAYCVRGSLSPEQSSSPLYYQDDCVMPLGTILWVLALQCIGYCLLALYFDNVLPDCNGVRRAPWYFLQPSYWVAPYVRRARVLGQGAEGGCRPRGSVESTWATPACTSHVALAPICNPPLFSCRNPVWKGRSGPTRHPRRSPPAWWWMLMWQKRWKG